MTAPHNNPKLCILALTCFFSVQVEQKHNWLDWPCPATSFCTIHQDISKVTLTFLIASRLISASTSCLICVSVMLTLIIEKKERKTNLIFTFSSSNASRSQRWTQLNKKVALHTQYSRLFHTICLLWPGNHLSPWVIPPLLSIFLPSGAKGSFGTSSFVGCLSCWVELTGPQPSKSAGKPWIDQAERGGMR